MSLKYFMLLSSVSLLIGCQSENDQKFLGAWKNVQDKSEDLVVEKNGKNYVITVISTSCFPKVTRYVRGQPNTEPEFDCTTRDEKFPATYESDRLIITRGTDSLDMIVDQKTGYLLANGKQYKNISKTN